MFNCVFYVLIVFLHVLFVSIVLFYVLFVCKCVLYYCYQVASQLQLTNIRNTFYQGHMLASPGLGYQ